MLPIHRARPLGPLARRPASCRPGNHRLPLTYRLQRDAEREGRTSDPLARDPGLALLEAALFVADEPLPVRKLVAATGLPDAAAVRKQLRRLQELYERDGTAFQIEELAGGFQLLTRPEYHRWLASLRRGQQDVRLSPAARETLAIVAYRQPIMRAEVEAIRGVQCSDTLRLLMEKGLIRIAGRHDSLGRPVLYGTTKKFLQVFGLRSLKDLPQAEELQPPAGPPSGDH